MSGNSTTIVHPENKNEKKTFIFDQSYWSHDGFKTNQDGVSVPESKISAYADQRKVFSDLGQGVLDNAWAGYNAALFAYGQTGSGKSYSMVGYGANKGIIPITCNELFTSIEANKDDRKQFQVTFSMLEIYNEQVRDLLVSAHKSKNKSRGSLRVRQKPDQGFYCEGLKQVPVQSYTDIERLMEEGVVNRTTASTSMNATSSRSHMVITIGFKQVFPNEQGESTTKMSEISLVDLAGSERAASTEATGDRLREGSAINTSLFTLGNVIHALAEVGAGKRNVKVPYRSSILTKLLKSALGGNSKTIMIAALSPAAINYEETLSTLRYADRAKQIKNKAVVNESLTNKIIRELKEENQRLLEQLRQLKKGDRNMTQTLDVEQLLEENQRQVRELELSWEQRLEEARREWERSQDVTSEEMPSQWLRTPYLTNVNEDPQLSGVIKVGLPRGENLLGKPGAVSVNLEMRGLGIQNHHAIIYNNGSEVMIAPGSKQASITVNGKAIKKGKTKLTHLDRIKLGSNNLYLYVGFAHERKDGDKPLERYTHDYFQAELAEGAGFSGRTLAADAGSEVDPEIVAVFNEYVGLLPKVLEANAMSEDLGKGLTFELEVKNLATHDAVGRAKAKQIIVKVTNMHNKVWIWSKEKFMNRKFMMEDIYSRWLDGEDMKLKQEADPFWDPLESIFLGSVHVWLTGLAYCMETDDHLDVRDYHGKVIGRLHVKLNPCDVKGEPLVEEMLILDPVEMLGRRLEFLVSIPEGSTLAWVMADPSRGSFCRFSFYNKPMVLTTKTVWGSINPRYSFVEQLKVENIDNAFLSYLQANALVVELWGAQSDKDASHGSSVAVQKQDKDTEDQAMVLFLQEKLKRQEQELMALRREHLLLQQANARLQRSNTSVAFTSGAGGRTQGTRRKSQAEEGYGHSHPSSRKSSMDHGHAISAKRRMGVVFAPSTSPGHQVSPRGTTPDTPASPRAVRRVSIVDLSLDTSEPVLRPALHAATPTAAPRTGRRPSVSSPHEPPNPPPHLPLLLPSTVAPPGSETRRRRQVSPQPPPAPPAAGGEVERLDVEMTRALKVFFKDMKGVQHKVRSLRRLGEDVTESGGNGQLKVVALQQHAGVVEVEGHLTSLVGGLKDSVLDMVRRRRRQDPG